MMFHDEFVAEGSSLKSVLDYWVEIHPLSKQDKVSIVLTGTNSKIFLLVVQISIYNIGTWRSAYFEALF